MACDDRQLTEAQRQAAFQQQRTGVQRAVRPFTGRPTIDNLIDYINRELQPAVKQSRDAVNDIYLQVADQAPSANPLAFYFSTETAAADPTTGRIRLNASPENTATTIRVSQVNGRLQNVAAWLDVMAGGATTPLGVVTLFDAVNPSRFLRFDLTTMADQGAYWDLGVTIVESSHPDPFVADQGVVMAFIPGVSATGSTVPPTAMTPIAANTVLGNATGSTAAPTAIPLNTLSVLGRSAGNITAITAATGGGRALYLRTNDTTTAIAWATISEASLPLLLDGYIYANMTGATSAPIGKSLANMAGPGLKFNNATIGDYQFEVRFPGAPIYDVMDAPFNAVGNGVADDTAAINAAIFAANTTSGVVYLGPAHRVTAALGALTSNNIWVVGRGRFNGGTHIILDSASSVTLFTLNAQYCGVFGMWISGAQVNLSTAIKIDRCYQAEVGHVLFSQIGVPIESYASTHTDVYHCNADDTYGSHCWYAHGSSADGFNHAIRFDHVYCGTNFPASVVGTAGTWASGQSITAGNLRFSNGNIWQAASSGTTGVTAPTGFPSTSTSTVHTTTFNDGGVTWYFAMPLNAWFCQGSYSQTFEMADCGALQGGYGLSVEDDDPGTNSDPIFTRVHNFQTDHPFARGVRLRDGKAAEFTQLFVTSVQEGYGVEIASTYGGGWRIVGGEVFGAAKATVLISKGDGILSGVQIAGGSTGFSAIEVTNSASNWVVENCIAGTTVDDTSPDTSYGINIGSGCDVYIVQGNIFRGHVTGAILNTPGIATTRIVRNNVPDTSTGIVPDGDYGDITVSSSGTTWTIDNDVVTNAKAANMASPRLKGRTTSGTGDPEDLTLTNSTSITWNTSTGGTISTERAAFTGDVTATANSNALTIANDAVTNAKLANMADSTIKGRAVGAGSGDPTDLTGVQAAQILRYNTFQNPSAIAASTQNDFAINATTMILFITVSGSGDLIFTGFAHGSSNTGARFLFVKQGSNGRILFKDNDAGSASANRIWTPGSADIELSAYNDAIEFVHNGFTWFPKRVVIQPNEVTTARIIDAAVTSAKISNRTALSVFGRSANSSGVGADIAAANDGEVLRRSGTAVGFGTIATAGITDAAVTLAKMADLAQSRIIGRAEGAGTGVPTALTPTQVVAIIDGENATWTGAHSFTGANTFTVNVTGAVQLSSSGSTTLVSSSGGNVILAASTTVDINSPTQLNNTTAITAVQSSATVGLNNVSLSGSVFRFTASNWLLTGIVPNVDGQTVLIVNAHATDNGAIFMESVSSTAANRFSGIGTSRVVRPGEMALAWYDGTTDRWRLLLRDDVDL